MKLIINNNHYEMNSPEVTAIFDSCKTLIKEFTLVEPQNEMRALVILLALNDISQKLFQHLLDTFGEDKVVETLGAKKLSDAETDIFAQKVELLKKFLH